MRILLRMRSLTLLAALIGCCLNPLLAQNTASLVNGQVTDQATGAGMPGVNVLVKGTTAGTVTDVEGNYSIQVPDGNAMLVFSFIGYATQEVAVSGRSTVNVSIAEDATSLGEVVVVGYGVKQKRSVTSSITKLDNAKLSQVPNARVENTLAGRMAGVQVTNGRNRPGEAPEIRVRGVGSISAGNDPLVVIDGFPGGSLSQVNMNDIESIEVLKDASSTAIYGSRGASGVILITTKRGSSGKTELKMNHYFGFSKAMAHDDWLTGEEWYNYLVKYQNREFAWNGGDTSLPMFGDPARPVTYQVNPLTYELPQVVWQDEVLQTAPIQSYNLSLSGGNEKTRFYVSGTYTDEKGTLKTASYKQYVVRANMDVKVNDVISVGLELSPSYSKRRIAGSDMVSLVKYPPFVGVSKLNGRYPRTADYIPTGHSGQASPYTFLYGRENLSNNFTNIGRAFINLNLMEGLSFKSSIGTNISFTSSNNFGGRVGDWAVAITGSAGESQYLDVVNENVLSYNKTFNEEHTIGGILGASYQQANSKSTGLSAVPNSFNNEIVKTLNNALINPLGTTQSKSQWGLVSYFARVNYTYKDKYIVEGSYRTDGSSRFGKENKWGAFPSASAAWRVSEEPFFSGVRAVSELKLRASYGVTGNFNIGNFQYLGTVSSVPYSPNNQTVNGIAQTSIENPLLSWEKTKGTDFGFDLGLFNNRVSLSVDYYDNRTTDMLYSVNTPAITGFTSTITNAGEVRNHGIDLELETKNLVGDFKWNTSFNFSRNRNEVIDLGGVDQRINTYWSMDFLLRKGEPMFSFFGYNMTGIYQNIEQVNSTPHLAGAKPGNPILQDVNNDGAITPDDKVILGSFMPKMTLGLSNEFFWKNFDLSIFVQASLGANVFNAENQYYEGNTLGAMRRSLVENQWWSEAEPGDGMTPAAALSQLFSYNTNTSYYIEDASYMAVRNLNLGFTLPANLVQKVGMTNLRVYTSVNNLLVLKDKDNHAYNPEGTTQGEIGGINSTPGVNMGSEPINRTIVFGLNVGF
jgi:TonB-dependent starch-binding outer membrane protein SusC